jgi:DNA polymerase-3 subunit delta
VLIRPAEVERLVEKFPDRYVAALLFGPDQGLVHERADRLTKSIVPDLGDPFRVVEFDGAALLDDRARLFDEAAALSMTGGRRVVRVRDAGNALANLFTQYFAQPSGDALIVVEGGELAKGAALRASFEEADNAAAIACYLDSPETIGELVRSTLKAAGTELAQDALAEAVSLLGADRGTTRRELEKLALYAHGQKRLSLADIRAVMGDEAEARIEDVCDAAGRGDPPNLDRGLERLAVAGISPIAILRTAIGHFQRLALARARVEKGESPDGVLRQVRPPIHFTRQASFRAQLRDWNEERLADALDLLLETEALCKTTAIPAEAVCGRALFTIAAWARLKR